MGKFDYLLLVRAIPADSIIPHIRGAVAPEWDHHPWGEERAVDTLTRVPTCQLRDIRGSQVGTENIKLPLNLTGLNDRLLRLSRFGGFKPPSGTRIHSVNPSPVACQRTNIVS